MKILRDPVAHASLIKIGRNRPVWEAEIIPSYMGRYAIYRVLNLLGVTVSDDVLIPTYHCMAMAEPILRYGCGIGLYRINTGLQTNVQDIERVVGKRTRAVILIHYFGLPQRSLEEIKRYLEGEGIFLIEDCAHVIPKEDDVVGGVGDVSIYTPRKYLPVPDGAIIRVNNPKLVNQIQNRPMPIYNELKTIKNICEQRLTAGEESIFKRWYGRIDGGMNRLRKRSAKGEVNGNTGCGVEYDSKFAEMKCSLAAQYMMRVADFEGIYRKRIETFEYLFKAIYSSGVPELLEFLDNGKEKCILGFPVVSPQRERMIKILKDKNIQTFTFGENLYLGERLGLNSDEIRLSKQLFFVPLHQDIGVSQLKYLGEVLEEVLG